MILFILFCTIPLTLAANTANVEITGPSSLSNDTYYNFSVQINADTIVGHSIDVSYDSNQLEFINYHYVMPNGADKTGNSAYVCVAPIVTSGNILDLDCAKLGGSDPSGVFVKLEFKTKNTGITTVSLDDAIITNVTNNPSGGYPTITLTDYTSSITPEGFSYGTAVLPSTIPLSDVVNVSYPITFSTTGLYVVTLPSPYNGNSYWLKNGSTVLQRPVLVSDELSLDLVLGNSYELITDVNTPTLTVTSEDSGEIYNKTFSIVSTNPYTGVFGEVSVNKTYQYFWLDEFDGDEWKRVNVEKNVVFDNDTETLSFENLSISGTSDFKIIGNITCQNNWLIGSFGACVNNIRVRIDSDVNFCTAPFTRTVSESCSTPPPGTGGNPGGGGGGGGDRQVEAEYTTITTTTSDINELTVTYLAYGESVFNIGTESFDIGDGIPYAGFVITASPEVSQEKISNVVIDFTVNEFWKESNGVTDIEIFHRVDDSWIKLSQLDKDSGYTAFATSLGSFAIVGYIPDQLNQIPGEIDVQTGDGTNNVDGPGARATQFKNLILPIIFSLVAIGAVVTGIVLHARHPASHGHPKQVVHDKFDQLNDYVKKARGAGLDDDKIKENLKHVGWTDDVINSVFKP